MRYPSRHVAALAKWGALHGIEYGGVQKSGHVRFLLPGGGMYTTGSTPSDVNATEKARRDLCHMLNIPYETGKKSGRHRHHTRGVYTPATERTDSVSARYAKLAGQHRDVCDRITRMQTTGAGRADQLVAVRELCRIETQIERLGRDAPRRTFRVHNV